MIELPQRWQSELEICVKEKPRKESGELEGKSRITLNFVRVLTPLNQKVVYLSALETLFYINFLSIICICITRNTNLIVQW